MQINEYELLIRELQVVTDNRGVTDLEYLVASLIVNNQRLDKVVEEVKQEHTVGVVVESVNALVDLDSWLGGFSHDGRNIPSGEVRGKFKKRNKTSRPKSV